VQLLFISRLHRKLFICLYVCVCACVLCTYMDQHACVHKSKHAHLHRALNRPFLQGTSCETHLARCLSRPTVSGVSAYSLISCLAYCRKIALAKLCSRISQVAVHRNSRDKDRCRLSKALRRFEWCLQTASCEPRPTHI
jgi:hypothetical protein